MDELENNYCKPIKSRNLFIFKVAAINIFISTLDHLDCDGIVCESRGHFSLFFRFLALNFTVLVHS